jgi:hypothetical protein
VVVRLAREQGLLGQRKLTPFQHFGLIYALLMERKQKIRDEEDFIRQWTAVMDPIRFRQVYMADTLPGNDFFEVPGLEVQPDDFSDIDEYLRNLDKTRTGRAQ